MTQLPKMVELKDLLSGFDDDGAPKVFSENELDESDDENDENEELNDEDIVEDVQNKTDNEDEEQPETDEEKTVTEINEQEEQDEEQDTETFAKEPAYRWLNSGENPFFTDTEDGNFRRRLYAKGNLETLLAADERRWRQRRDPTKPKQSDFRTLLEYQWAMLLYEQKKVRDFPDSSQELFRTLFRFPDEQNAVGTLSFLPAFPPALFSFMISSGYFSDWNVEFTPFSSDCCEKIGFFAQSLVEAWRIRKFLSDPFQQENSLGKFVLSFRTKAFRLLVDLLFFLFTKTIENPDFLVSQYPEAFCRIAGKTASTLLSNPYVRKELHERNILEEYEGKLFSLVQYLSTLQDNLRLSKQGKIKRLVSDGRNKWIIL